MPKSDWVPLHIKLHLYRKMMNLMIVIVTKKTAVKIRTDWGSLKHLTVKMWIVQMTSTKTLMEGLNINLTWVQLIRNLPRKSVLEISFPRRPLVDRKWCPRWRPVGMVRLRPVQQGERKRCKACNELSEDHIGPWSVYKLVSSSLRQQTIFMTVQPANSV